MSRYYKPFVGLFTRGSLGHYQYSTGLLPLPISASPHHTHALHHANSYRCDDCTISLWLPRHLKCEQQYSKCDKIPANKQTSHQGGQPRLARLFFGIPQRSAPQHKVRKQHVLIRKKQVCLSADHMAGLSLQTWEELHGPTSVGDSAGADASTNDP